MYKYIKAYQIGYNQGIIEAVKDYNSNKKKVFKKLNDKNIRYKLYDAGFIDGYNKTYKNITLNLYKSIV